MARGGLSDEVALGARDREGTTTLPREGLGPQRAKAMRAQASRSSVSERIVAKLLRNKKATKEGEAPVLSSHQEYLGLEQRLRAEVLQGKGEKWNLNAQDPHSLTMEHFGMPELLPEGGRQGQKNPRKLTG